jgi:hypothetical protein
MTETDKKIRQQAEWLKAHTLTPEQNKQLILNKLRRASEMREALIKREMLVQKHR